MIWLSILLSMTTSSPAVDEIPAHLLTPIVRSIQEKFKLSPNQRRCFYGKRASNPQKVCELRVALGTVDEFATLVADNHVIFFSDEELYKNSAPSAGGQPGSYGLAKSNDQVRGLMRDGLGNVIVLGSVQSEYRVRYDETGFYRAYRMAPNDRELSIRLVFETDFVPGRPLKLTGFSYQAMTWRGPVVSDECESLVESKCP